MATQPSIPDLFDAARTLGISISPSTPTIGAEISGLDLDRPARAVVSRGWEPARRTWV